MRRGNAGRRLAATLAAISSVALIGVIEGLNLSDHELIPHVRWMLDPDYSPSFAIGSLVFNVPNRYLAYPWTRGTEPASSQCIYSASFQHDHEGLCSHLAAQSSLTLEMPLPLRHPGRGGVNWLSSITVTHGETARFPAPMLSKIQSLWQRQSVLVCRMPENDVDDYDAFLLRPKPGMYSGRIFANRTYEIMIRANEIEPRYADCVERGSDQTMRGAECVAEMGYLTDVYPLNEDGRYPYLISFSLPIWALPQSTTAGLAVSKFVSRFIVSQDGIRRLNTK